MTARKKIEEAFKAVDRAYFVPPELKEAAYENTPLPIGHGATISQPTTVAFMLGKLDVREGQKVLDVGSGSGWTTAFLAYLVGPEGEVIGLEIVPELVRLGQQNIRNFYADVLENNRIAMAPLPEMRQTSENIIGLPDEAPFDRILVSAAGKRVPDELIEQLAPDGVLVIPVGEPFETQKILRIHKKRDRSIEQEEYPGFVFVPLK